MDRAVILKIGKFNITISCLMATLYLYICRYSILAAARFFSISTYIVAGIILVAFFAFLLLYTFTDKKNVSIDGIIIIAICAVFFIVTLHIHPEYMERYLDLKHDGKYSALSVFSYGSGIYVYYLVRLFKNNAEKLYKLLDYVAVTILLGNIWTFIGRNDEYQMTFGFQMEMAAIIFMCRYLHEKKWMALVLSVFCMLLGILYGSRSCVLGYAFFIILYFIWQNRITIKKIAIMLLGGLAALMYSSQTVMTMIYNFFESIGIHSRTLYYIAEGNILAVDTARQEKIWPVLIEHLKQTSFFEMAGAFGDRYLLASKWVYAHNIVLEILVTFGKFLGGIILLWIAIKFIKVILKNKDEEGLITIIFGSFSLCELMFSSSFWTEPYFWAFIAMLINCSYSRKQLKKDANVDG